jgi:transglutaminase-like putative cysteine protease
MLSVTRKILYLGAFVGLVATVAVAIGRVGTPNIATPLLFAGVTAALAAAPGLIDRRAWPASLVLVPLGAYLVLRARLSTAGADTPGDIVVSYLTQLRTGVHIYTTHSLPFRFDDAPELAALLVLAMYAAVALAAILAMAVRRALGAVIVLLAVFGFGLTIDESGRLVWLPFAFLIFAAALLTVSRSLERQRWRSGDAFAGLATAIVAGVLALSLLGMTSVARSTPWQDWHRWGSGKGTGIAMAFDWMQDYPSLLNADRNGTVMKVKSPVSSYWRANALDAFDGRSWYSSGAVASGLNGVSDGGSYTYAVPLLDPLAHSRSVTEEFKVSSLFSDYLFTGGTATSVTLRNNMPLHLMAVQSVQLDRLVSPGSDYTTTALVSDVTPADLVGLGRIYPENVLPDLALPFAKPQGGVTADGEDAWRTKMSYAADRDWLGLYRLDRRIVGDATDPYQIALRIEEYLRTDYTYSLQPPASSFDSPYASFLFSTKQGYCQHFAGAMAVLLRFNGVPARVAVGFSSGVRDSSGWYEVTRHDAHAWVEAYFPGAGWVPFDPTPGRALPGTGASSTNAGFNDPFLADPSSATANGVNRDDLPTLGRREQDPGVGKFGQTAAEQRSPVSPWLPAAAVVLAVVCGWPLGRAALRLARLRRGDPERRLRAAVAAIAGDLRDYGLAPPPSQTLDETAAFLKGELALDATDTVGRAQAVLFGGREPKDQDVAALIALHHELRSRLRARSGLLASLRAAYGLPRSNGRPARLREQELRRRAAEAVR